MRCGKFLKLFVVEIHQRDQQSITNDRILDQQLGRSPGTEQRAAEAVIFRTGHRFYFPSLFAND